MVLAWVLAVAAGGVPGPRLPPDGGVLLPARLEVRGPGLIPSADLADERACGSCHPDVAAQWRTSAHALASFTNPIYRVSVERLRDEVGATASRACAGCHDPALLTSGAMDGEPIAPDDPRAHAGISCTTCHGVIHATAEGNGSLVLTSAAVFPATGEDSSLAAHRARVAPPVLRSAELCAGCHRAFLDASTGNRAPFFGMDDFGEWRRSAWAGSTAERHDRVTAADCRGCHMAREPAVLGDVAARDGTIASHRFLGGHTTLAAMRGDADTLRRVQAFLAGAAEVDVAAARINRGEWLMPAGRARPVAGDRLELDVVVFNQRVGHRFPGGVLDNQGTFIELTVTTSGGVVLAADARHQLRSEVVDPSGSPRHQRETHHFLTPVWNHTVASRDARAVRYALTLPADLPRGETLTVHARVVHRARLAPMMQRACQDAATERGKAFLDAAGRLAGQRMDPCVDQPLTTVAAVTRTLDGTGEPALEPSSWRGLGLTHGLQESLDEAEAAFTLAGTLARSGEERARVTLGLARVAARRGQLERALGLVTETEALLGGTTAATARVRGEAQAQVWRWPLAAEAFAAAAERAPRDITVLGALAMARASAGDALGALLAAGDGLALDPRDADCLRVQALALERLGRPSPAALEAALRWRTSDEAPGAKARCGATVPLCATRRDPVPRYTLEPAPPPPRERAGTLRRHGHLRPRGHRRRRGG